MKVKYLLTLFFFFCLSSLIFSNKTITLPLKKKNRNFLLNDDYSLKNNYLFNISIGLNGWGEELRQNYDSYTDFTFDVKRVKVPLIMFAANYGIHDRITVGFNTGIQHSTISFKENYFTSPSNSIVNSYEYKDTRIATIVNSDFFVLQDDKKKIYFGVMCGYNFFMHKSNVQSSYKPFYEKYNNTATFNVHCGINYYFIEQLGVFGELALGKKMPYILAVGITSKF